MVLSSLTTPTKGTYRGSIIELPWQLKIKCLYNKKTFPNRANLRNEWKSQVGLCGSSSGEEAIVLMMASGECALGPDDHITNIWPNFSPTRHRQAPTTATHCLRCNTKFRNKENAISINAKVYNCIILPFHCLLHICCGHCTLYSVHCSWPLDSPPFQHQVQSTTFKLVPPLFLQLKI